MAVRETPRFGNPLSDLLGDTGLLLQQSLALLKAEMREKLKGGLLYAVAVLVGAFFATLSLVLLLVTAILGLATVMPAWLAALCVTLVALVLGVTVIFVGVRGLSRLSLTPERTVRSTRATFDLLREKL